jgi:hypothetical protein
MFEIIEDDLTPELRNKFVVESPSKYLVYFDPTTSNILTITNESRLDLTSFFEIDFEKVKMFLTGQQDPGNYKVVSNPSKTFEIVSKIISHASRSSSLVPIKLSDNADSSLTLVHNSKNKSWIVTLSLDEQRRLINDIINYRINIFVTSRNNKNMLYRMISLELADLVKQQTITVPFISAMEDNISLLSLSTVKFLESYTLTYE